MSCALPSSPTALFSIPLEHLWRIDFSGGLDVGLNRTTGLARFVGDDANRLLRYVTTDDFLQQLVGDHHNQPWQKSPADEFTSIESEFHSDASVVSPIVFYGASGTGKTSLAMALIARLMLEIKNTNSKDKPEDKPIYLTGAEFARRFYSAIDTDTVDEFRQTIFHSPALLLDDIEQLVKKAPAQKELESLLDQMARLQRPVFVICNALPATIDGLSARLVSRLSQGLTVPFHPPGQEARTQIAHDLAAIHQFQLTDDAIDLLNQRFEVTVPRMEHLFGQIKLKQRLDGQDDSNLSIAASEGSGQLPQPVANSHGTATQTVDADMLLSLLTPDDEELLSMIRLIQKRVANQYKLRLSDIRGNSRKQTVVEARGVAIYLTRQLLGTSFLKIGCAFGNRDHSTILHSFRKIEKIALTSLSDSTARSTVELGCSSEELTDVKSNDLSGDTKKEMTKPLTARQKETAATIDRLKQELTDLFATQICLT